MAKPGYAERYAQFVVTNRWAVLVLLFAATLFASFYVKDVNLRNDPDSLLPLSNRYIATNLYNDKHYGMGNIMVWGMKVKQGDIYQPWFMQMLDELYKDASNLEFAKADNFAGLPSAKLRNLGLSEEGHLDFSRLMPSNGLAEDKQILAEQLAFLRAGIENHPVMEPLLIYYEDDDGNKCEIMDKRGVISNDSIAYVRQHCTARGTFIVGDFDNTCFIDDG